MAAPSNAVLLDYEGNIEDALRTHLATQLPTTQCLSPRTLIADAAILTTPRVTVAVQITGTNENQQDNRDTDGSEYDSHKLGTVTLVCATRRDGTGQALGTLRGSVRAAMIRAEQALNVVNLPYYQVITLREGSATMGSDPANDEIFTSLTYAIEFYIRRSQWAAS
jgi:hypothetical protein